MGSAEPDGAVDWSARDPASPQGEIRELGYRSRELGRDVHLVLYIPARIGHADRVPLVVAHDGGDYLNRAQMATVLDNLMHRGLVADCIVAFVDPGERLVEYAANPAHSRFLTTELIPDLEAALPLLGTPAGRVLVGASFGGVATLAAAAHAPGFFGGLMLESASLRRSTADGLGDEPLWQPVISFVADLHRQSRRITGQIYQTFGSGEALAPVNRAATPLLRRLASEVQVAEVPGGGHNWQTWRDALPAGLAWLLPGRALRGRAGLPPAEGTTLV